MIKHIIYGLFLLFIFTSCTQETLKINLNRVKKIKGNYYPLIEADKVTFRIFMPQAEIVNVAGSFNSWNPEATALSKNEKGEWTTTLELKTNRKYAYKYLIDGFWVADPDNPNTEPDGYGGVNSIIKTGKVDE